MVSKKLFYISSCVIVILLVFNGITFAQDTIPVNDDIFSALQISEESEGEILLFQDASINVLVDKHKRINQKELKGYRIQIYRGSGQKAREDANASSYLFTSNFPAFDQTQVYAIYESPYFKLRIGDYRTKNDAFEFLYHVKRVFPNAYIVATKINFPKLEVSQSTKLLDTDE